MSTKTKCTMRLNPKIIRVALNSHTFKKVFENGFYREYVCGDLICINLVYITYKRSY